MEYETTDGANGSENTVAVPPDTGSPTAVNRRDFVRTVALAGASGVGLGTVGMAAAATDCKDESASYSEQSGWWHRKMNSASADNYDCQYLGPYYKVEHAASITYYGSCYWNDSWKHEFHEAGHAEHFTRDYCNSDWAHSHGIREHSISFFNDSKSTTSMPISQNQMVKGAPPVGSYDNPTELMDYAYTALNAAVGYYSWPLGTAMALAGVYVDNLPNDPDGSDPDTYYDWDYGSRSNARNCGTHFVKQMVHGNGGGQGEGFDFDCHDEAWGYYPNYTRIEFDFDYSDAYCSDDCSCPNSSSTVEANSNGPDAAKSCQRKVQASEKAPVEPGGVVEDSKGRPVEVEDVDQVTWEVPGREVREVAPSELPGTLAREIDADGKVPFKRFPMKVTKRRVSGKLLD